MTRSVLVVTNCTNRKRISDIPVISAKANGRASLVQLVEAWQGQLKASPQKIKASDLYVGRSFSDALAVTELLSAKLYIASAGLGLISAEKKIPPYNLTVSPGESSLLPGLRASLATPSDWWLALNKKFGRPNPISTLIGSGSDVLALIALPANYISMLAADFSLLSPGAITCLRIFTSGPGIEALPESIRKSAMPYDERLEGSAYAGTRTDFPQRALRHFVECLGAQKFSLARASTAVSDAMNSMVKPELPERHKKTDAEIRQLIRKNWTAYAGSSSRLLRYLRDDALVACEQSRFRGLWHEVRNQIELEDLAA